MTRLALHILQQALFGGFAAAGFGVLFNFGRDTLIWCTASGMLALATRTTGLAFGWSLEGASLAAAAAVTTCTVGILRRHLGTSASAIAVAGCIPMIPGAFFAQALLGMFDLTTANPVNPAETLVISTISGLRVVFTVFAIGAGISVPVHLLRGRDF
ncbi:MAG: threonine/serine exporter family protein [Acetobacteraceae bacterium]|nr:threonine/serine exporter family protein [Acetobacteraceae bacterium]